MVEIEAELASLQEEKIITEQQLEEAKKQVPKKGSGERWKDAKRQLELVEKQLKEIEKKANGLNADLEKAKLEKADASVRKIVESKHQEPGQQAKKTGGGKAEHKLIEVKRELANHRLSRTILNSVGAEYVERFDVHQRLLDAARLLAAASAVAPSSRKIAS